MDQSDFSNMPQSANDNQSPAPEPMPETVNPDPNAAGVVIANTGSDHPAQIISPPPKKTASGAFRATFFVLLLLTMASAGASTYILMNWNQTTSTRSNAQTDRPVIEPENIENTPVEINPFSDEAIEDNPFESDATDSANIFADFDTESDTGDNPNPF